MRPAKAIPAGFTLIELLVVIAIVGVLAGLLVPAMAYGRFKARITGCSSQFRQLALAAVLYADTDGRGRLPAHALPTETTQLTGFRSLAPWIVGLPLLSSMEAHGIVDPKLWFCPTRDAWQVASSVYRSVAGRPLATIADLTNHWVTTQRARYAGLDVNWWVPRPLEGDLEVAYPDPRWGTARIPTPWPTRVHDPGLSVRPLISDWLVGHRSGPGAGLVGTSGGHVFGGRIRSCHSGYADGHVEIRGAARIQWEIQLQNSGDLAVGY